MLREHNVELDSGQTNGAPCEKGSLERCLATRSRVTHRNHPAEVPDALPRRPEHALYAGCLDRVVGSKAVSCRLDVLQERWRPAVKCMRGALREGELSTGRDEIDNDDGLDFEVQCGPNAEREKGQ